MHPKLVKDIDYTIDENGNLVFTKEYHLKRGRCCQSGCLNCPYGYSDKVDPSVPAEFNDSWEDEFIYDDDEEEGND